MIQELNKKLISKQSDKQETLSNLNKWLLFDSASTIYYFSNKKLIKNIYFNKKAKRVISNGGQLNIHKEANITRIGIVPFSKHSITNLVSMSKLIDLGLWIYKDTAVKNTILYSPTIIE